jgi:hypothetical protein
VALGQGEPLQAVWIDDARPRQRLQDRVRRRSVDIVPSAVLQHLPLAGKVQRERAAREPVPAGHATEP